jgi:UDP-glucose 4-epimerase
MRLSGRRVLVTGGAGFIGSHLVELLAEDNLVTVLDDLSVGCVENLAGAASEVRVIQADVTDPQAVAPVVGEAEVVFHLAVVCLRDSIGDPIRSLQVNDLGTLHVLQAARDAPDLERLVYISSSEIYGTGADGLMAEDHVTRPMTPYAASKLAGEAMTLAFQRTYGLHTMVVRPFNAYGPRAHLTGTSGELIPRMAARAMAGRPLVVFGDGDQSRDFTWVGDTVRGIAMAAACDILVGDVVNIARGEGVSVLRIAELIQALVGTETPIRHLPPRPGDVRRHHADIRKSRDLLGFQAQVGIEEGLRRYVEWLADQPGDPASWLGDGGDVNWRA